jgi:predicted phage tail protein
MRRLQRRLENVILILFTAFGAVFVAEIVGDKLLHTSGVLAARYRTMLIMLGMAIAFMAKMGVAVLVGDAVSKLSRPQRHRVAEKRDDQNQSEMPTKSYPICAHFSLWLSLFFH